MKKLLIIVAIVAIASIKSFAYTGFVETTQYAPYQIRSYYVDYPYGTFVSWDLYAYGAEGTYASIVNPCFDRVYSNGFPATKWGAHWFVKPVEDPFDYVVLVVFKTDIWDANHQYIVRIGYASASASWN